MAGTWVLLLLLHNSYSSSLIAIAFSTSLNWLGYLSRVPLWDESAFNFLRGSVMFSCAVGLQIARHCNFFRNLLLWCWLVDSKPHSHTSIELTSTFPLIWLEIWTSPGEIQRHVWQISISMPPLIKMPVSFLLSERWMLLEKIKFILKECVIPLFLTKKLV